MKRIGHDSKVGCVLNVDMKPEVPWDRSVYGHSLTNHGSLWNLNERYFDGVDDYIDCGNNLLTGTSAFTLMTLIKIINHQSDYAGSLMIGAPTPGNSAWIGALTNNNLGGGFYGVNYDTGISPDINTKYSLVHTFSGGINGNSKIYVDKTLKTNNNYTPDLKINDVLIGKITPLQYYFNGLIKTAIIYNYSMYISKI